MAPTEALEEPSLDQTTSPSQEVPIEGETTEPSNVLPVSCESSARRSQHEDLDEEQSVDTLFPDLSELTIRLDEWRRTSTGRRPKRRPRRPRTLKQSQETAQKFQHVLNVASEALMDRLFTYLSRLPDVEPMQGNHRKRQQKRSATATTLVGLTLPASAIGWLSQQLASLSQFDRGSLSDGATSLVGTSESDRRIALQSSWRDRLALIRFLLPRLRHLRITNDPWPTVAPAYQRTVSITNPNNRGVDQVDSDNDTDAVQAELRRRLEDYHSLVFGPRVHVEWFVNCQVLLLDQVPPEWICNLQYLSKLRVLRVERSCIYNLPRLLGNSITNAGERSAPPSTGDDGLSSAQDPLRQPPINTSGDLSSRDISMGAAAEQDAAYRSLTHLKFSNCGLSDYCGWRGTKDNHTSPFSRMTQLRSICLSHNEITSQRSVLVALADKPFLSKVDLSHNRIYSLRHAHYRIGNIQSLRLSYNQIQSVQGIDRLYSLESLWLDHNQLTDLAHVNGLARLPELQNIWLEGNPLQTNRRKAYRVDILNLFCAKRQASLPADATFRQLQQALPVLDGQVATLGEMKALRNRAFQRSIAPTSMAVEDTGFVVVESPGTTEGTPLPSNSMPILEDTTGSALTLSLENVTLAAKQGRKNRRQKRRKRREAHIEESVHDEGDRTPSRVETERIEVEISQTPSVTFTVRDVLESISEKKAKTEVPVDTSANSSIEDGVAPGQATIEPPAEAENETEDKATANVNVSVVSDVFYEAMQQNASDLESTKLDATERDDIFMSPLVDNVYQSKRAEHDDLVLAPNDSSRIERALDISSLSPIKHSDDIPDMKSSVLTAATVAETNPEHPATMDQVTAAEAQAPEGEGGLKCGSEENEQHESGASRNLATGTPTSSIEEQDTPSSFPRPLVQLNLRVVSDLWQDDNSSVPSTMGKLSKDENAAQNIFALAEENSTFCGAAAYKELRIVEHLDLYFRLFVFNYSLPDSTHATLGLGIDDEDWHFVLEHYPKIQLWPIDRRMREAVKEKARIEGKLNAPTLEEFRRVWKEKVVACGKPALRRLTPNRGARYGFHGELLWSAASTSHIKPETVAECRETILCLSNAALYFILDNDAVSDKARENKRKFPLPIRPEASFEDAVWPHALARHPLETLRGIIIGFGFQRLTLRFSNSTYPCPDDFTYILLTSNKMETVELLKDIQALAAEVKRALSLPISKDGEISIENDDRHVLDALGVAVAPDVIDTILHFQILQQRWKHGERGEVRRVVVVTEQKMFLLDEDYVGDGSESIEASGSRALGETVYRLVDSADLRQIDKVKAADADPNTITIAIRPNSRLQRTHNWRLLCRDRTGAEQLVEDVRKAMALV